MAVGERYRSLGRFIFHEPPDFFLPFVGRLHDVENLTEPLEAFQENLRSAILVGSIPYLLVHSSVLRQRFIQLDIAERIRSGMQPDDKEAAERATEIASAKMSAELQNNDIVQRHANTTLRMLDDHLRGAEFELSSRELLRQVLVLSWGAFEVFVNDTLRTLLNTRPELVSRLFTEKLYKDAMLGKEFLCILEGSGFDLSKRMGDLFCDAVRIDTLEKIRDVMNVLFRHSPLEVILKDGVLWRISQQRNLIVHRRGVVDARYIARTGDNAVIGQPIEFSSDYVEECLVHLRDSGLAVVDATRSLDVSA